MKKQHIFVAIGLIHILIVESAERRDFSEKNETPQTPNLMEKFFTFHTDAVCLN